jgi:4-hydroxybenzoate-CoA ligase
MHVHSTSMTAARLSGQKRLGMCEDDVVFSAAKMFFAYGLNNTITCPMSVGATAVVYPGRATPEAVFDMLRRHRPTVFYGVPTLYAAMLADPSHAAPECFERLRLCFSAGEPLPPNVGLSWKERFGLDICDGIGATELGHLFLTNVPGKVEYGVSGVPIEGYDMRLVDELDRDVADGEIGELLVRGATAAAGYWNQREKSRKTFMGEWTRTGDKYTRRADGAYTYCGRTDDMFKSSGIWVSPFEVEAALVAHPRVLEAAVVPAATQDGLIKPKAFIVLKDGQGEGAGRALYEDIKTHVKRTIGPWKYPRWIEFVENLPKTATGKIQRYKLRGQVEESVAPDEGE